MYKILKSVPNPATRNPRLLFIITLTNDMRGGNVTTPTLLKSSYLGRKLTCDRVEMTYT